MFMIYIVVNSNVLSKIYTNLLKNQFLPKVVQAIYNTFTVYHIHIYIWNTLLLKKVMIMQASICILQSNTFLLSISLTLIGRSCKSSRAVKKSVLKVTTKKLEEREKSINKFTKTHQVTWRHRIIHTSQLAGRSNLHLTSSAMIMNSAKRNGHAETKGMG